MPRDVDAGKFSMDRPVLQTEEIPAEVRAVVAADCDVLEAHFSLERISILVVRSRRVDASNRGDRPTIVFDAAFEGGQSAGADFLPAASCLTKK